MSITRTDNEDIIKALRRVKHSDKLAVGKTETGMTDLRGIKFPGEIYIIRKFHFDNVDFQAPISNAAGFQNAFSPIVFLKKQRWSL